jgi:hypothetical protein
VIVLSVFGPVFISASQIFSAMTVSTNKFKGIEANMSPAMLTKEGKTSTST